MQQVNQAVSDHGGAVLLRDKQDLLKGQISDLWRHSNPVRTVTGQDILVKETAVNFKILLN